jgi:hypothetical protein
MATGRLPGASGIPETLVNAKGDLIVGLADNTVGRLAVGSNNSVLTADSSTSEGVKWVAVDVSAIEIMSYMGAY